MEDKKIVTPVQPYLTLDAEDYQELLNRRMGISSFYEFNVKNGNSGNFRDSSRWEHRSCFWNWRKRCKSSGWWNGAEGKELGV
ncbi:MAG: hypothetical protein ACLURP_10525 [Ruminococcus sp.]